MAKPTDSVKIVLNVVVGIVLNDKGQILVAKRPEWTTYPGYWEFPGGKQDPQETLEQALIREFEEEIGIQVTGFKPFMKTFYQYPDRDVYLNAWWITGYRGHPHGREGQRIQWLEPEALCESQFPEANQPIINALLKHMRSY